MAGAIAAITGGKSSLYDALRPVEIPVRQLSAEETAAAQKATGSGRKDTPELEEAFRDFVSGTFAKTMLKSMRKTTGKVPYMDGGFAEKVFQEQLDEHLAGRLSDSQGGSFSADLYDNYLRRLPGTTRSEAAQSEEAGNVLSVVI